MEEYRIITEREIYDDEFGKRHKTCMEIAIKEAKEMAEKYNLPIELFDISALTFQAYKMWTDKLDYIRHLQKERQAILDKEPQIINRKG